MSHPIMPRMPAIFVPVSDLKRSTEWYADLLERHIVPKEHDDGIYVFDFNGTEVILDSNSWGNSPMVMFDTKEIAAAHQFCEGLQYETLTAVFSDEYISVFTINSNMICQTHRAEGWTRTKPAHALLKKISYILIHSDNLQESAGWYEKFVARSANPDSLFEELPCIRMDEGAFLLIDDNRLCQSPRVYYENLKLDIH
jgi:predicted lactoylglutathione lyase